MSDTPRTDAFADEHTRDDHLWFAQQCEEFARTLERELAAANAELGRLKRPGYVWVPEIPTYDMLKALGGEPVFLAASLERAAREAYEAMLRAAKEGM